MKCRRQKDIFRIAKTKVTGGIKEGRIVTRDKDMLKRFINRMKQGVSMNKPFIGWKGKGGRATGNSISGNSLAPSERQQTPRLKKKKITHRQRKESNGLEYNSMVEALGSIPSTEKKNLQEVKIRK